MIAEIKHIGAYDQEYNHPDVNSVVSRRPPEEIYQKPFAAAVEQGQAGPDDLITPDLRRRLCRSSWPPPAESRSRRFMLNYLTVAGIL